MHSIWKYDMRNAVSNCIVQVQRSILWGRIELAAFLLGIHPVWLGKNNLLDLHCPCFSNLFLLSFILQDSVSFLRMRVEANYQTVRRRELTGLARSWTGDRGLEQFDADHLIIAGHFHCALSRGRIDDTRNFVCRNTTPFALLCSTL